MYSKYFYILAVRDGEMISFFTTTVIAQNEIDAYNKGHQWFDTNPEVQELKENWINDLVIPYPMHFDPQIDPDTSELNRDAP